MQGPHVQNHGMVQPQQQHQQHQPPPQHQQQYQQIQPVANQILQVFLENHSEESTHTFTLFVMQFRFSDNTFIGSWLAPNQPEIVMKGRILEALAHWISGKAKELDGMVPMAQTCVSYMATQFQNCRRQLEQASYQSDPSGVLAEFIYTIIVRMLGQESACLANALAGGLAGIEAQKETLSSMEWPAMLLSMLVRRLEEMQAKVSKVVMEMYSEASFMSYEDSKCLLMQFFRYYTVQTTSGTLEVHESYLDPVFQQSPFRVALIDSFGCLMQLLTHLENICSCSTSEVVLGVDFEGVKLCRHGELCLVQMTCSDDPHLVYVLDVYVLGSRAFSLATPNGMSMKRVLEEQSIRKVWFDPRNDVDALYHQFGVMPEGIFDLQLAEVADRRNRGLHVSFVQGLQKCLGQCPALDNEQKVFADKINTLGKQLFEPNNGGDYDIFRRRPLHPVILVYSAHDSRYMLLLYQQYQNSIGREWVPRVLAGSDQRARWCLHLEYVVPNSEAPDF